MTTMKMAMRSKMKKTEKRKVSVIFWNILEKEKKNMMKKNLIKIGVYIDNEFLRKV